MLSDKMNKSPLAKIMTYIYDVLRRVFFGEGSHPSFYFLFTTYLFLRTYLPTSLPPYPCSNRAA